MTRFRFLVAIAVSWVALFTFWTDRSYGSDNEGNLWLATISVSTYPKLPEKMQLKYCDEDAKAIVERFVESSSVVAARLCELRVGERSDHYPNRENILRELPRFLSQADTGDTVVLFFSMHGLQIRDPDATKPPLTFLCPADTDLAPDRVIDSVIPIAWLRNELHRTRAQRVILFLDACHSGGIHNAPGLEPVSSLSSKGFETVFRDAPNPGHGKKIYVLARCRDRQVSMESPMLQHGLFTHWLTCGFDGAADSNADAKITMDELFGFVEQQVPKTAQYIARVAHDARQRNANFHASQIEQNPVRFFFGNDQGDIEVIPVAPKPITTALKRTSEMLDIFLRSYLYAESPDQPARIGIVEFGLQSSDGMQDLRGHLGSFGSISRDLLDRELNRINTASETYHKPVYRVAAGSDLKQKLKGFDVNAVESIDLPAAALQVRGERIDALLCGRYLRRGGSDWDPGPDRMELDLTLLDTRSKTKIARIQTVILVNRELLAMLGGSIDQRQSAKPTSHKPPSVLVEEIPRPEIPHPQFDAANATLSIRVLQKARLEQLRHTPWLTKDRQEPNSLAFATKSGNEIALDITNNTDENLAFVVQIDGANQIGRSVASPDRSPYWHIRPRATARIDQWLDELNDQQITGKTRELAGKQLVIVSAPESVALQRKISESLGEIRVIVYGTRAKGSKSSRSTVPSIGVGEGTTRTNHFPVIDDLERNISDQRAIYVIRYLESDR